MIKFFRKIRQNLFMENKTGKPALPRARYIKYAIGEIILVVIGILIALQINNWNENRNEKHALNILTENLHNEFTTNLKELEIDLIRIKRKISAGNELLSYFGKEKMDIPELHIDSLLFEAIELPTWNPSTFTLNEIKNAGKLTDIKDVELKALLYTWERLFEDILEWQNALETSNDGPINIIKTKGSLVNIDFYKDNTQNSKFDINNLALLQEVQFENEIENNIFNARALEKKYREAKVLLIKITNHLLSGTIN
ncbi:hypothetical protein GMA17_06715 [Bizionia sp. M204]|nr:DUF6090 family protein [Bizionia sp. M204]UPS91433.1 hypothetical protein GMA17_06715 [Bizionia sp. M204]